MQEQTQMEVRVRADWELEQISVFYTQRAPEECVEQEEPCVGIMGLNEALAELQRGMLDNYEEHLRLEPNTPAPRIDDSLLVHMASYHTTENAVGFIRNGWMCANTKDVVAALTRLRDMLEAEYNENATKFGLPGIVQEATAVVEAPKQVETAVETPSVVANLAPEAETTQSITAENNWAHQALLQMDEVEVLVRFCSVNAPEEQYTPAAKAFWNVCYLLAQERARLHAVKHPAVSSVEVADPFGWQLYATAPRDGTLVDIWSSSGGGSRLMNVAFRLARDIDEKYAPGGDWEHLGQDGWRSSSMSSDVYVDKNFTHWRLSSTDRPAGTL